MSFGYLRNDWGIVLNYLAISRLTAYTVWRELKHQHSTNWKTIAPGSCCREKPETASTFPHSPDEITVDWLNGVLRDAGVLTDDALESVEDQSTDAGFGAVASHARLMLYYTKPLPRAPQSLFGKFSSGEPTRRARFTQMY